jgi:50S ribosomal protein L16 3-hydroxylase
MILQPFDREEFIRNYWQKKPLLIKHQGPEFKDPISAEELAGLACEYDVESRLVTASRTGPLELKHGPFTESSFTKLGERNWTLLVQAVDQYVAAVDALKSSFDFIPRWRIDDIMVSFASDGGGVGPHYDQYDVFLLQGSGSRKWELGPLCDSQTPLRRDTELRVLAGFKAECEFTLEPGDILYLPPRIAHHGTSLGNSLCYSVGFRAPSVAELIQGYTDVLADTTNEDQRYTDSLTTIQHYPDELTENAIDVGFSGLMEIIDNKQAFINWFGCYVSMPRYPERIVEPDPLVDELLLTNLVNNSSQVIELN